MAYSDAMYKDDAFPMDLIDMPGHLLRRCHQRSHDLFNEHLGEHGLTRQQAALLITLQRLPRASVQDLTDESGVDRNTLAGVVSRLVSRKLISRKRSPDDARAYELTVTRAGLALLVAMRPGIEKVQKLILEPLPTADRARFLAYLRIVANLQK